MFIIFGSGKKFTRKEGGKTIQMQCPNCRHFGEFYEVDQAEYISIFFVPVLLDKPATTHKNPYYECPQCKEKFALAGLRFAQTRKNRSFWTSFYQFFEGLTKIFSQSKERSQQRKAALSIEKELKRMKRTLKKEKNKGDR